MTTIRFGSARTTSNIRLANNGGSTISAYSNSAAVAKIKVTKGVTQVKLANANFAYIAAPGYTPTLATRAINDLSSYSNTEAMLQNVATAYANAVNYVDSKSYVNSSSLAANLAALELGSLNNVDDSLAANNATLVFNTSDNKYIVKQLDLDGGNF